MTDGESWAAYASAAQQLGALRQEERERTGGRQRGAAAARADATELSDKLMQQQSDLTDLGRRLRLPAPMFGPAGRAEVTGPVSFGLPASPEDRLARARQRLQDANVAADSADDLGDQPALLPNLRPLARNAVVYAGASAAGLLAQLIMMQLYSYRVVSDPFSMYAWTCCGFPAVAFFVGYLVVGIVGRPRSSTGPVDRSPKWGALICVASLPVYTIIAVLLGQLF